MFKWGGSTVNQVTDFSGPSITAAAIDVTDLASENKAFLQDVEDSGEISLTMTWDPDVAIHERIALDSKTETTRVFLIQFQNAGAGTTEWTCNAFVSGLSADGGVGAQFTADATFKMTGALTVT